MPVEEFMCTPCQAGAPVCGQCMVATAAHAAGYSDGYADGVRAALEKVFVALNCGYGSNHCGISTRTRKMCDRIEADLLATDEGVGDERNHP